MPAATDPPPLSKPSRYRTVRGKSAPASRRYVELAPTVASHPATTLATALGRDGGVVRANSGSGPDSNTGAASLLVTAPAALVAEGGGAVCLQPTNAHSLAPPAPSGPSVSPSELLLQPQVTGHPVVRPARPSHRPPPLCTTFVDNVPPMHQMRGIGRRESVPEADGAEQTAEGTPSSSPALPLAMQTLVPLLPARARAMAAGQWLLHSDHQDADKVAQRQVHAERLLAEQKRKDLERLQRELANHQPAPLPPKSPSREMLSFFTRRRGHSTAAPPASSPLSPSSAELVSSLPGGRISPSSRSAALSHTPESRVNSASGPSLPPSSPICPARSSLQMDAPSSAPGTGAARYAVVRYQTFSATVPVSPELTVADFLESAAGLLPCPVDPATSLLIESYSRLGLERRLRRYERIRDIMNSWDKDTDNTLRILHPDTDVEAENKMETIVGIDRHKTTPSSHHGHVSDLNLSSVSRSRSSPPPGFVFMQMYHSQKPGRWVKRYVTLIEGIGQVVASKKVDDTRLAVLSAGSGKALGNASLSGEFQNLCHLSDYDIYKPTDSQTRKHLRPPKHFCFALKSQQRTTVFVNTENYVHYFSTDDPTQATAFYSRIFAWRSWYLVNLQLALPDGSYATKANLEKEQQYASTLIQSHTTSIPPSSSVVLKKNGLQRAPSRRSTNNAPTETSRHSTAESLFRGIGNHDLTLDFDRVAQPANSETSTRVRRLSGERGTFSSSGLLGDTYDERNKTEVSRQHETATHVSAVTYRDAAFPASSSLLAKNAGLSRDYQHHGQALNRPSNRPVSPATGSVVVRGDPAESEAWAPSALGHTAQQRSKSTHQAPESRRPLCEEDIPLGLQYPQVVLQQSLLQQKSYQQKFYHNHNVTTERDASLLRSRSLRHTTTHISQQSSQEHHQQQPLFPLQMPEPLIDLTPRFQEAPQWSKEGKGHGVRAPPGTAHLVDLATDRNARTEGGSNSLVGPAPPSNANLLRRDKVAPDTRRAHTMTSSTKAVAAGFSRSRSVAHRPSIQQERPALPLLPRAPTTAGSTHGGVHISGDHGAAPR